MNEVLEKVENYWDVRSESYCQGNLEELNSFKKDVWIQVINEYSPKIVGGKLSVLDIGTGPGFFAIIMAESGHNVTAIDYTEAMLEKAKSNASMFKLDINFKRMDSQNLEFEDNTFDLIISRNLTWNLEKPGRAYREWHRVLKPGGRLLNFDANWYLYLYDEEKRKEHKDSLSIEEEHPPVDYKVMENIAKGLPLSKINRPKWDAQEFIDIGFKKIIIDTRIGDRVWNEDEKLIYKSTPMFMVGGEK